MTNKFKFGQKVHCYWYNSWFYQPPAPCTIICKLPYSGSYYPHSNGYKEPFYLVKVYKGFLAAIPEGVIKDLKDKVDADFKYATDRPKDYDQARSWDNIKKWNERDFIFLNSKSFS